LRRIIYTLLLNLDLEKRSTLYILHSFSFTLKVKIGLRSLKVLFYELILLYCWGRFYSMNYSKRILTPRNVAARFLDKTVQVNACLRSPRCKKLVLLFLHQKLFNIERSCKYLQKILTVIMCYHNYLLNITSS
jgi:hypothetical protein